MVYALLPLSRPAVSVGISALLVSAVALSGCTSTPEKVKAGPSPTSVAPTTTSPPVVLRASFTATGIPAELSAVVKSLYLGGAVASSASVTQALRARKPVTGSVAVVAKGAVAKWKGVPIAVITKGNDVTLAVAAPRWRVVGGWWPSLGVAKPSLGRGPRRVLMVGSDARPGQSVDRSRADSLHIVGLDGHGGGGILGIPRDSYVQLATGGRGKINSALAYGGPVALQRTVVSATGVPLEGYVITGFTGFKALVNGIGGLPMKVPVTVVGAGADVVVRAGQRTLTGREALAYGRQRHSVAGGDFGRSANQGLLIMAAAGFTKLLGPGRLPLMLQTAAPNVGTNLTAEQVLTFAAGVYVTSPRKVRNLVASGGSGMTGAGESIVVLNAKSRAMFANMRDGNLS